MGVCRTIGTQPLRRILHSDRLSRVTAPNRDASLLTASRLTARSGVIIAQAGMIFNEERELAYRLGRLKRAKPPISKSPSVAGSGTADPGSEAGAAVG